MGFVLHNGPGPIGLSPATSVARMTTATRARIATPVCQHVATRASALRNHLRPHARMLATFPSRSIHVVGAAATTKYQIQEAIRWELGIPEFLNARPHKNPSLKCPSALSHMVDSYSRVGCNHIVKISLLRNIFQPFAMTYSFTKVQFQGLAKLAVSAESYETSHVLHAQLSLRLLVEQTKHISICKSQKNLLHDLNQSFSDKHDGNPDNAYTAEKDYKETQRRRKIGLANKGKTPWNKGRKHSAETCALIKQRTLEALSDPKVRRKMSEWPHAPHSVQSKAKLALSLRRAWGKRLKWKRLQENCYLQWAKCIAKEAKEGGLGEEELDWDSYDKIKAEVACQELQRVADKAKAKEIAKVRAQREAKAKSEKKARLAQMREEKEQKAQARELRGMAQKKSEEEEEDSAIFKASKLKVKLTKINHKSMVNLIANQGGISNGEEPALQVWDLDFIKKEKMRREVSLADQIRAIKKKNAEPSKEEALDATSSDSLLEAKVLHRERAG